MTKTGGPERQISHEGQASPLKFYCLLTMTAHIGKVIKNSNTIYMKKQECLKFEFEHIVSPQWYRCMI